MNVIPEGALHARKNNMDLAKDFILLGVLLFKLILP